MNTLSKLLLALALALSATTSFAAKDPADGENTQEHPEVTRFPGFYLEESKTNDFNEFRFSTKSEEGEDGTLKEGKFWFLDYWLKENQKQPSTTELIRNYENAFKKLGGAIVKRHPETAVFRMPLAGGSERWVQLNATNDGAHYRLTIIETGAMAQKLEFSASEMAQAIKANGYVALNGILFDTAKATIKPESEPLLSEIVAMMNADKGLKLSVEGHTDNVGDKKMNLDLSQRRAESVMKYLVGKGIDAKRLKSTGKGDTAPVADNRSEAGKAKNRRVELVKF